MRYCHTVSPKYCYDELAIERNKRNYLPPPCELKIAFENADKLAFEKKVTESWNLITDKLSNERTKYFRFSYPGKEVADEITKIFNSYGYKCEFQRDVGTKIDFITIL